MRVFNDRGSFTLRARVNGKPRRGVVVAPSVWWKKFAPDGRNANDLTSQRTADLGGGATFYDCLVQVERADASARSPQRRRGDEAAAGSARVGRR